MQDRIKERIKSHRKIKTVDGSNIWGGYSKVKVKSSKEMDFTGFTRISVSPDKSDESNEATEV